VSNEAKSIDLDLHAAKTSQDIIQDIIKASSGKPQDTENLITKALGVLQENGVYACVLFLYARSTDAKIAKEVRYELLRMTFDLGLPLPPETNKQEFDDLKELLREDKGQDWKNGLKYVSDGICSNLDTLLLVRQLWEQTLIYARYGAKSWKENLEAKNRAR
jgi:hypothetical protein